MTIFYPFRYLIFDNMFKIFETWTFSRHSVEEIRKLGNQDSINLTFPVRKFLPSKYSIQNSPNIFKEKLKNIFLSSEFWS